MSYDDKTLTCRDCGKPFTFTAGEQEFFDQKGFASPPARCASCRQQRKASGFGVVRGSRELFNATCGDCGGAAEVPFTPRGDRPVYCSDCFQRQRA